MFHGTLANDRLADAANAFCAGYGRYFNFQFEANFVVRMNARGHIEIDAHVDILKLRVHQRTNTGGPRSNASLEAARCNWYSVPDFQCGLLPIRDPDFRILDDSRRTVGQDRIYGSSREGNTVVRQ